MDIREVKTERSITNAFLQLRKKKSLEKITVTELSKLAEISKATFYLHYKDIYDLSEQLQNGVIQNILSGISNPEYCLTDSRAFTEQLYNAFYSSQSLIETLFSGTQSTVLPMRVEKEILSFVKKHYPEITKEKEMQLTYTIYGGYYVYQRYGKKYPARDILGLAGSASNAILKGQ